MRPSCLELALDVNASKGSCFMTREDREGLATGEDEIAVLFRKKIRAVMVDNELGSVGIGLKE